MYHTSFTIWWSMNKMIILEWLTKFILIFYTLYYLNTFETANMTGVLLLGKVPQMSRISVPRSSSELDPCDRQWLCAKGVIHLDMWIFFRLSSLLPHHWWPCTIDPDWLFIHLKWPQDILCPKQRVEQDLVPRYLKYLDILKFFNSPI